MEGFNNQYPVGLYFSVSVDGSDAISFQEVSGISKEINVEDLVAGSENQFKYRLPTGSLSKNLVLKRGLVLKDSSLLRWCMDSIDGDLSTPIQTKTVALSLLDKEGKVLMKWIFHNAYPIAYSVFDLQSQQNEIAIESIELSYTYFDRMKS